MSREETGMRVERSHTARESCDFTKNPAVMGAASPSYIKNPPQTTTVTDGAI